jgi:hypothetical protein
MKCLSIQIHPDQDLSHSPTEVVELAKTLGRFPEVNTSKEEELHVNLNFFTEDLALLWEQLRAGLFEDAVLGDWLKTVSIAACEGDDGWEDYKGY